MPASYLNTTRKVTAEDIARYEAFKARRTNRKEETRARLAAEFPLLFGKDAVARSTMGKYSSKHPTTPNKSARKPPVNDNENVAASSNDLLLGSTIDLNASLGKSIGPAGVSKRQKKNNRKRNKKAAAVNATVDESQAIVEPALAVNRQSLSGQDVSAPTIESPETASGEQDESSPVGDEQVQDVLDYMLECNEVDEKTHRRLSMQAFSAASIRRLSVVEGNDQETASEQEKEQVDVDQSLEVTDLDVLNALRVYVSTLDHEVTSPEVNDQAVTSAETPVAAIAPTQDEIIDEMEKSMIVVQDSEDSEKSTAVMVADMTNHSFVDQSISMPILAAEKILTFPRNTMLHECLSRGLVTTELTHRIKRDNHVKYVIYVQLLDMPGVCEEHKGFQLMLLKRFSDFKEFREALLTVPGCSTDTIPPLPSRQIASFGYD